jgi:uncharacterized membrane protein
MFLPSLRQWRNAFSSRRARHGSNHSDKRRVLPNLEQLEDRRVPAAYTYATIDFPGAPRPGTFGLGINNAGQIVGAYGPGPAQQGFLLSGGAFSTIDFPGAPTTFASGINDAGQIVGSYIAGVEHGYLRKPGGAFSTIDFPGATFSTAFGINSAGQIVGAYETDHAYLFSGGVYSTIDFPGATTTQASGINSAGQIVGLYGDSTGGEHGFLLVGGVFTTLDFPSAAVTDAFGINDVGQIVGDYIVSGAPEHGFVLSGGVFSPIDVPGATFTIASGIKNAGQIVGIFGDASGTHGFLATPAVGVQPGQTEEAAFWHSHDGQALIRSFNGGSRSTALADWLAARFPNVAGANAGSHDLTGLTNAQVADLFQHLYAQRNDDPTARLEVQLLSTALNVYTTTKSLGGPQGAAYGFLVTAGGLGSSTFNVGNDGAAFGVADGTTLTVDQLLAAVDSQAAGGVLYPGHPRLRVLATDLLARLNQAGD